MSDTLYPIFYGTRLVTFDVLRNTFEPHMHPLAAENGFGFILHQGGKFGIGSGYRPPGTQPKDKAGFAAPGLSFHEGQEFPSGRFYAAWDMVVVNPGYVHRAPLWSEVPAQGTEMAKQYAWHMNVGTPGQRGSESWHGQPIDIDGWGTWNKAGKPDLRTRPKITVVEPPTPRPQPPQPPVPPKNEQITTKEITVEFTSRYLKNGMVGSDVKFFQKLLNELAGQGLILDGHYGNATQKAVSNWQVFFGLYNDGEAGPKTQGHMIEIALTVS